VISLRLGLRGCCAEARTPCLQARIGTRADRPTPTVKGMFAEDLLRDKICTYRLDNGSFIDGGIHHNLANLDFLSLLIAYS
jgi:hypothetical protein